MTNLNVAALRQVPSTLIHKVHGNRIQTNHFLEGFKDTYKDAYSGRHIISASKYYAEQPLDISWLSSAAQTYNISDDPKDYVIDPVPLVTVDFPNRNLQAFPFEEVTFFDPILGRPVYSSFIGKPTHIDHENKDPLQAKGVNLDAALVFVPEYNVWKIIVLSAFDRTKDPYLTKKILSGERNTYSMGALVEYFVCSACGTIDEGEHGNKCKHMLKANKGKIGKDGVIYYQRCIGANFIENSNVGDPADITAYGPDNPSELLSFND